jgi:hypothetical protein
MQREALAPGKRTLAEQALPPTSSGQAGHEAAAQHGIRGPAEPLPYRDTIQRVFGRHDVSRIRAHTDAAAAEGARAMGAEGFALGDDVAFATAPSLHVAAHEAAHVVQQRGGVQLSSATGGTGDASEQHAEAVAECVTSGRSAEALLDRVSGGGGGKPVVQRYTVEHGHRVSSQRAMAIEDTSEPKRFFAKPEALARSNAILEGMKSKVKLAAGGDAPEQLAGMKVVTPAPRGGEMPQQDDDQQLFDVNECIDVSDRVTGSGQTHAIYQQPGGAKTAQVQSAYDLARLNKVIEILTKRPDVKPEHVIRAQDALDPQDDSSDSEDDRETYHFTLRGAAVETSSALEANNAIAPKIANRNLRIALLLKVLKDSLNRAPELQQQLANNLDLLLEAIELKANQDKDEQEIEVWASLLQDLIDSAQAMSAKQDRARNSKDYARLGSSQKSVRALQLGVNEYAQPDVGEAYGVMSTRERTDNENDKWSFHFAAVVGRDEGDSVTLENYNRYKGSEGNAQWYFDMQGPREQSFHDKHKGTVVDGVTLRMGEAATPDMREELRQRIAAKLDTEVPVQIRLRIEHAVTRAELAAIYADAISG